MKTKILFLSIILLFLSTNIFAQKLSASEFVESFYEFHRARSGIFSAEEVDLHKKWFTAELYELFQYELKREKEFLERTPTDKPYLAEKPHFGDGFPFAPMEECYVEGKEIKNNLKIGKTTIKGDKTIVEVKFYYPKVCGGSFIHAYQIELAKNNGDWLINDLIYLDSNERLTDDLKRAEY